MMINVVLLGITVSMFIVACSMSRTTTVESAMNIENVIEHDITNDECENDNVDELDCMFCNVVEDCLVVLCNDPQKNDPELKEHGWKPGDYLYEISVDLRNGPNVIRCFYTFEEYNEILDGNSCEVPVPFNPEHGCFFEEHLF